jgi:hypothetical protein
MGERLGARHGKVLVGRRESCRLVATLSHPNNSMHYSIAYNINHVFSKTRTNSANVAMGVDSLI